MKARFILFAFAAVVLLGLTSCAPEIALEWSDLVLTDSPLDPSVGGNLVVVPGAPFVYAHYTIKNASLSLSLKDCKLELTFTPSIGFASDIWQTIGVDLSPGQTSDDQYIYYSTSAGTVTNVMVLLLLFTADVSPSVDGVARSLQVSSHPFFASTTDFG